MNIKDFEMTKIRIFCQDFQLHPSLFVDGNSKVK